jgi:hypothetical protein
MESLYTDIGNQDRRDKREWCEREGGNLDCPTSDSHPKELCSVREGGSEEGIGRKGARDTPLWIHP